MKLLHVFIYIKPDGAGIYTAANKPVYPIKSATANKKNILGVDLNEFLFGMFAASLWWYQHIRTFQQFEQPLLNTFAADVARN